MSLKIDSPRGKISAELKLLIQAHKDELISYLVGCVIVIIRSYLRLCLGDIMNC